MNAYGTVIIETYLNSGEQSSARVRFRLVWSVDGISPGLNVEYSRKIRERHPIGTLFLIEARLTEKEGGNPFLYAHYDAPYRVISQEEADRMMA